MFSQATAQYAAIVERILTHIEELRGQGVDIFDDIDEAAQRYESCCGALSPDSLAHEHVSEAAEAALCRQASMPDLHTLAHATSVGSNEDTGAAAQRLEHARSSPAAMPYTQFKSKACGRMRSSHRPVRILQRVKKTHAAC